MQAEAPWRVGQGFDIHVFAAGRPLVLGGVRIEHDRGLLGHSDADALLHAVMDALLGAAGLADIGHLFPNTDAQWKDADSLDLLAAVGNQLTKHGWGIVNIDATVLAEAPKLAPHMPAMIANIARTLGIDPGRVNLKATTMETLGAIGRGEGIAAQAVALLGRLR